VLDYFFPYGTKSKTHVTGCRNQNVTIEIKMKYKIPLMTKLENSVE